MKIYNLTFLSKNQNSLNNAFFFFFNNPSLCLLKKYFQKKTKKHFFTVLKSPHVNKTAQEQFETRTFYKQLILYSPKKLQHLLFLKKIQSNLFSDVMIKIKILVNKKKNSNIESKIFNPNNFKTNINQDSISQKYSLKTLKKKNKKHFKDIDNKKIKYFIKTFDIFGEIKTFQI